ncbi:MAG: zf-HC2 domain-containing protein [Gammaproteobacteria bacterium]
MSLQRYAGNLDHEEAWALLPWYVNDTLGDEERPRVERHLADCAPCRDELSRCWALAHAVQAETRAAWSPSPAHLGAIIERIERAERRPAPAQRWHTALTDLVRSFRETPRAAQWALAAQAVLVLVLGAALFVRQEPYGTLSSPEPLKAEGPRVQVVFAEDLTERELRVLLRELGAEIVRGPTPAGVYTLRLSGATSDVPVPKLRGHPKVRLAEPKSGP